MHIQNRTATVIFNFIIGALAALATWIQFLSFGHDAWRLFATWVTLVAAIYYMLDAIVALLAKRRPVGAEFCPMLQGGLIVSGITLLLIRIICYAMDSYIPSAGGNVMLSEFILPVLMIVTWVMFNQKGKWRVYEPFYWLALPGIYAFAILVSGEFMPHNARLIYPYEFLDYPSIGIDTMLWWFAIFAVVILIVGYIFWILDFAMSGKLSKHIVMPKIKTVVIEEEVEDEKTIPEVVEKPEEKPVKLVTTGSRNLPVIKAQAAKKSQAQSQPTKPTQNNQNSKSPDIKVKESTKPKASSEKSKADATEKTSKPSTPPVRIIEKVEIAETKKPQSPKTGGTGSNKAEVSEKSDSDKSEKNNKAEKPSKSDKPNSSQEIIIADDKKSASTKAEKASTKEDSGIKPQASVEKISSTESTKSEKPQA